MSQQFHESDQFLLAATSLRNACIVVLLPATRRRAQLLDADMFRNVWRAMLPRWRGSLMVKPTADEFPARELISLS
jgi:hypothetical protein